MASIIYIFFSIILMNTHFSRNNGHPVGRNGIIEGKEFLSIFLNQQHTSNEGPQIAHDEKSQNFTIDATTEIPEGDAVEKKNLFKHGDMLSDSSNYYEFNKLASTLDLRTTTNGLELTTKRANDVIKDDSDLSESEKNIVKYITSGSKIVFLEDLPSGKENQTYEKLIDEPRDSSSDEIKVFSVSKSSSEKRSDRKILDNKKHEFSLKEGNTETQDDSVKESSMRVQTVVTPPTRIASENSFSPFETVIVHDEHFHKEGSAKPRSVQYGSLTQSTNPKLWESENDSNYPLKSNRTTKQHVSEPAPHYTNTEDILNDPAKSYSEASKIYSVPAKFYSQPSKVYSEPAKVYGRQETVYSVPAKIYSEPSRVYSQPSKVYSVPSKIYGEPSKFYAQPSNSYVGQGQSTTPRPKKVIFNLDKLPYDLLNAPNKDLLTNDHRSENRFSHLTVKVQKVSDVPTEEPKIESTTVDYNPTPEQNYEIDETVSVMTNGRQHGVQISTNSPSSSPASSMSSQDDPDPKVGYVVEGRNFRKYRVEERTADGFIVGEYGVVSNDDGSLRGVRYTADSNINPNLIYEALMKFLSL